MNRLTLTPRLQMISEEISKGETMADIGTDHGFLPIFLLQKGVCPFAVMTDISQNSLKKAEANCEGLPKYSFELRVGYGIEVIKKSEVDIIVIAGMGGILMVEILGKEKAKAKSFKKLVLQPRSRIGFLRYWLYNNGFSIEKEQLVQEREKICEILTVVPKEKAITRGMDAECIEYQFPHSLVDFKNNLTVKYLTENLNNEKYILSGVQKANNRDFIKERRQSYRVEYLEQLLKKCKEKE